MLLIIATARDSDTENFAYKEFSDKVKLKESKESKESATFHLNFPQTCR